MTKPKPLSFDIFVQPGPSRTSVHALLLGGKIAGRVITAWPSDGAGRVRLSIQAWRGPWSNSPPMRGQAGGYGYDKESAAFDDALARAGVEHPDLGGRGMNVVREWMISQGYQMEQVL